MGNQVGTKFENSALRSTAGSETHWLIFWHFDSHVIRLYHDIVGVILLLDGDANLFQKVPRKDVEERNIEKYTATLDGKTLELTIVNDSPGVTLGGVELFNANSKYSYNPFMTGSAYHTPTKDRLHVQYRCCQTSFLLNTLRGLLAKSTSVECLL